MVTGSSTQGASLETSSLFKDITLLSEGVESTEANRAHTIAELLFAREITNLLKDQYEHSGVDGF